MPEIWEYVREKLEWAADRVLELLTGSSGYRVQKEKARVPEVGKVAGSRQAQHLPPSDLPCDRY